MVLWRPKDLRELTPKKDVVFILGDWNVKVGSQDTWVTGKLGLGVQNEAGQRLREFRQDNELVTANTLFQQHKRRLYTRRSPDGQYRYQTDYILCSQRWRNSIRSAKKTLGADCRSDHELLIAKFRLKLEKVEKTTRPFSYDLNQIPYDYTVEVRNRFKGLDLIDKSAWWTMDRGSWHFTGGRDHDHPQEKDAKAKWLSEEALQIADKRREVKGKGEKEKYYHLNAEFQKIARREKKAVINAKK